jgi:hypothetical protein
VPESAGHRLLGRGAGPRGAGEEPPEASQILLVLSRKDGEGALRRHEPQKPAPPVDDDGASAATACQLRRGELFVDLRPDRRDRLDELRERDIRAGGEQPLDRDETEEVLAFADLTMSSALS